MFNVFLKFLQVHHEEQTTSAGFLDQPQPTTESSSPDPDIKIMSKNSSSTSKYVRKPAAAWILVLLLALKMLQNNSANSVVADNLQLYLHQACVTKERHQKTHKTIFQNYYDFLHDHVWLLHTCVQVSGCLKFIYYLSNKMYALTVTDNKKYYRS